LFTKMLIPLDGSSAAEEILPYSEKVAAIFGSSIVVLNVAGMVDAEVEIRRTYVESIVTNLNNELRHLTESGKASVTVSGQVSRGYPAEEISRYAASSDIDFIMISPCGQSGSSHCTLGDTTEKVVRSSRVPVWIAPPYESRDKQDISWPVSNILVPLDGSKLGECVIPFLKAMARLTLTKDSKMTLLNVKEPSLVNADYPEKTMRMGWDDHVKQQTAWIEKNSQEYLNNMKLILADTAIKVNTEIIAGDPGESIMNYALHKSVNLIILATHGMTGIARLEYGAVADKILHRSTIPVLLIRPEVCYF
jgi:nucleotide-binding universal stress UspA family protein